MTGVEYADDNAAWFRAMARDIGIFDKPSHLAVECDGYQVMAARDRRVLDWLTGRVGLFNLIPAFRLGVARAEIDLKTGTWSPIDTGRGDAFGVQVITLPVQADPDDRNSVVDVIAFDAEDPQRCWLREGNVDLIGDAALHWARYDHRALPVFASPWSWLRGYIPVMESWWAERRSAEADCRMMAAQACIQADRTGWEWLRWAEKTLQVWMDQRLPKRMPAGMHGVCVLDHSLSYERLFEGVSALVGESPAHAQWIDRKLNEDRKRRRLAESLPQVGFVSRKTESATAAE